MRIHVKNLPFDVADADVRAHFEVLGPLQEVKIIRDPAGKGRGFGFVAYAEEGLGLLALHQLQALPLQGRPLRLEVARKRGLNGHSHQG